MGLFDKLIREGKKALNEVASEENKEKAGALLKSLKGGIGEAAEQLKQKAEGLNRDGQWRAGPSQGSAAGDAYEEDGDGRSCREKLLEVLGTEFPQYTVKENVSPSIFGERGYVMDYSMVIYDGAAPKLVIMIIGKTTTAHRSYRLARQAAEAKGVTFLNFIEHYPNRIDYITERLHKYI